MGISGLLPLLKPITKDTHVRELKGLTVGIDTYCWLHKGIYSCSSELCQGIPTDKFIRFCVDRVHLLLSHGVRPYLVFDGGYLPAKAEKEVERRTKREANMQRARQLLREGNASGAHQFFSKAADVTPFMAHQLIQVVKRIPGVRYVVAPYEADAQLGFLARNGHVDAVITEDSDILLFGCTRVLFKLERDGTGQEVNLKDVFSRRNDELDMRGMDEDDLVTLCALSGCDYLPSVPGVGLKKAHRLVTRHKQLPKILKAVKLECAGAFPSGYEDNFRRALLTFRHQRAFDPTSRTTVHMTPLPESLPEALVSFGSGSGDSSGGGGDPLDFLGPPIEATRASAVAEGDIDPITAQSFSEMARAGPGGNSEKAKEVGLSESSLEVLAAWRGAVTTIGRRGRGAAGGNTKKLSTQGNNLTKYWGAPVSKKSSSRPASSDEVEVSSAEPCFEIMDTTTTTPKTPRRGSREGSSADAIKAACKGARDNVAKEDDLAQELCDPARTTSCVSPSSFYDGVGDGSLPPVDDASKGKENRDLSPPARYPETDPQAAAKSKHFSETARSGPTVVTPAPAGLRRRSLRPINTDVASEPSVGGGRRRRKALDGDANFWGKEYACPREGTKSNSGSLGDGRLKRRKTLGVGSLAPKGIIRGLTGAASGGWSGGSGRGVGLGRLSKSVGGTPQTPSIGTGDGSESSPGAADGFVGNLFERFAARSPLTPFAQSNVGPSSSSRVHIVSQKESSGASAGGTDLENRIPSEKIYVRQRGFSRRAEEDEIYVQGVKGKVDQLRVCDDAGALLTDRRCGDKAGADERRVEGRTSLASRVDKLAGAGSAIDGDGTAQLPRGTKYDYDGHSKGGGCHVHCCDGSGLRRGASKKNGQGREALTPVRSHDEVGIQTAVGGAACKGDLFARFVYTPPGGTKKQSITRS